MYAHYNKIAETPDLIGAVSRLVHFSVVNRSKRAEITVFVREVRTDFSLFSVQTAESENARKAVGANSLFDWGFGGCVRVYRTHQRLAFLLLRQLHQAQLQTYLTHGTHLIQQYLQFQRFLPMP